MKNKNEQVILVVDDQPGNFQIIFNTLSETSSNYNILYAINGKIACEIVEKKRPDLIISDWEMPEMDGIELIKHLQKQRELADIPVIICSGVMTTSENLHTAMQAGAVDFIKKPIDKFELTARVSSMLKLSGLYKKTKTQNRQLFEQQKTIVESKQYLDELNTELYSTIEELNTVNEALNESNEKLRAVNATKNKFFSIISHDLKNPFNQILNLSSLLLKNYPAYDDNKRLLFLKDIHSSANNTYKLLENLLTWSRSQSDKITYKPETLAIKELIDEVLLLHQAQANKKEITLQNESSTTDCVFADKSMVETILRNLISNAIKFTPSGGQVFICARQVVLHDKTFIEFAIKDTGTGISAGEIPLLFQTARNVSNKGTNHEKGTGLGLILCKEFVEKNGGEIWVESQLQKGSTFFFTLPYCPKNENKASAKQNFTQENYLNIANHIKKNKPEAITVFETELIPLLNKVEKSLSINNIRNFAERLQTVSEQYQIEALRPLSQQLLTGVKAFDIGNIQKYLSDFKEFVKYLKA